MKAYSTNLASAIAAGAVRPLLFVQFDLDSGAQRYTTAGHDIEWDGETWVGTSAPVEIGEIRETESLEAVGVPIVIHGLRTSAVSQVLAENMLHRPVTIWIGAVADDGTIYCDPLTDIEFQGRCDSPSFVIDGDSATLRITVESRMAIWARPNGRRFTDADQQAEYPGDKCFEYVPQMVEKTLIWPAKEFFR